MNRADSNRTSQAYNGLLLALAGAWMFAAVPSRGWAQQDEDEATDTAENTEAAAPQEVAQEVTEQEAVEEDAPEEAGEEETPAEEPAEAQESAGHDSEVEDGDADANPTTLHFADLRGPSTGITIPPLRLEDSDDDTRTLSVFPFFYSRVGRESSEYVIGPYYQRRSEKRGDADVAFPLVWSFRGPEADTLVIPPFWNRSAEDGSWDLGLAPLFAVGGAGAKHASYTLIPPLLTFAWADDDHARTFAGPFWRWRDQEDIDWGIFPLVWGRDRVSKDHLIVPPFFFHFSDDSDDSATTVIPPVYWTKKGDESSFGIAPLLFHHENNEGSGWTIPPLVFHYSHYGDETKLVTPLATWLKDGDESTLLTPLYQRHRGETNMDAVAPFFFYWSDPREGASSITTPLFHHYEAPGRSSTWILPTLQIETTPVDTTVNLHPILYSSSSEKSRHLVLAPLYWDFENYETGSRATVGFPLFWRFRTEDSVSTLVGNTYYHSRTKNGVTGWEVHVFPFFSYGVPRPGEHWWNILYGLVGYTHEGDVNTTRVLWVPIDSSNASN